VHELLLPSGCKQLECHDQLELDIGYDKYMVITSEYSLKKFPVLFCDYPDEPLPSVFDRDYFFALSYICTPCVHVCPEKRSAWGPAGGDLLCVDKSQSHGLSSCD
jgi:hypothetical protein